MASKIAMIVSETMNSNAVVNTFLGVSFVVLGLRSESQQKRIEALEEEKYSLLNSNKSMKTMMWDWKQQLYAEAGASSVVPLSTLKTIYGELTTTAAESVDIAEEDGKSSAPKIMI